MKLIFMVFYFTGTGGKGDRAGGQGSGSQTFWTVTYLYETQSL